MFKEDDNTPFSFNKTALYYFVQIKNGIEHKTLTNSILSVMLQASLDSSDYNKKNNNTIKESFMINSLHIKFTASFISSIQITFLFKYLSL